MHLYFFFFTKQSPRGLWHRFSCEFCEISKKIFPWKTLPVAASARFFPFLFFYGRWGEGVGEITYCVSLIKDYEGKSSRRRCLCKELKELSELSCSEIFSVPPFHFFFCGTSFLLRVHWNWNLYVRRFGLILVITVNFIKYSKIYFTQFLSLLWHQLLPWSYTVHNIISVKQVVSAKIKKVFISM